MTNAFSRPVISESELASDCVICYEPLNNDKNICITECGHEFCFSCMLKHLQRNGGCPICRTLLFDSVEDEPSESEEGTESVDGIENREDLDANYPVEHLVNAFVERGYGLKDALSLLIFRFSNTDPKYTMEYINKLHSDFTDMNEILQGECDELANMAAEDLR